MISIRPAAIQDAGLILKLIRDLAEYERSLEQALATEEDILRDGFGHNPKFFVLIAEWQGKPAGFALYFFDYSTWMGKAGIYLEDLFVLEAFRGKGIGKALLAELAKVAIREKCYGVRWQVLDWNSPAIEFYQSLGSKLLKEWITVRITGKPLAELAQLRP